MKYFCLIIGIAILFGCSSPTSTVQVQFEGRTFQLPAKLAEIKEAFNLKYQIYRGFRGRINDFEAVAQLEDYPVWVNSKHVEEEFFLDKSVVGVFFSRDGCNDVAAVKEDMSSKYNANFQEADYYYFAKLETGLWIAVFHKKGSCYISFYNGITKETLNDYVKGAW